MRCVALLIAASLAAFAADATGKWTGQLILSGSQGGEQGHPAMLVLKQDGATLTGTAGPGDDQRPIQNGKVENGVLTFELNHDGGLMRFSLKQQEDEISGDVTRDHEGQTQRAKLVLKREK